GNNMRAFSVLGLLLCGMLGAGESSLKLSLRSRVEEGKGSGHFNVAWKAVDWDAHKTADVICDMGDKHWDDASTQRVGEMAARMNKLVTELRSRGALVIHAPSDTMEHYKDYPQYKVAQAAPAVDVKTPLQRWRKLDPEHEAPLPIDDSDNCETNSG